MLVRGCQKIQKRYKVKIAIKFIGFSLTFYPRNNEISPFRERRCIVMGFLLFY